MDRLLLVRHATTEETRRAAFPLTSGAAPAAVCAALDRVGREQATALRGRLPAAERVWSSHALRARATAECAGFEPEPQADLAECDFGIWAGRSAEEVHAEDPDGLGRWFADSSLAPHGGESLAAVRKRARAVLDRAAALAGTTVAFTHGGLVKAALVEALGLPDAAAWRLEAAPASVAELHPAGGGSWRVVRLNWTPRLTAARGALPHEGV